MKWLEKLKVHQHFLFVIGIALVYYFTAPVTVQSGDTGELVTNSFFLRISHPPGYPLWTLLYHVPVKYLGALNPFHAAAIFTITLSLVWLGLLASIFREKGQLLLLGVLATSLVVWRYAVLPDVFALHAVFLTFVCVTFLRPELLTKPWMIFLISLSVAHHHTIVFVFPLFVLGVLHQPSRKKFFWCLLFGFVSMSFYLLLFAFHPEDYGSWGNIKNVGDIADHFLRKDYGTLRLHSSDEEGNSWFLFFLNHILKNSWSLLAVLVLLILKHRNVLSEQKRKLIPIGGVLLLYLIIFSLLGSISLNGDGEITAERFLLQPTILFFFFVLVILFLGNVKLPHWLLGLVVMNVGANVYENFSQLNYRANTTVEDFLINSLNSVPDKSIYYTFGDTVGFGTYYLKDVKGVRPNVLQFHATWGTSWAPEKFKARFPGVLNDDDPKLSKSIPFDQYRFFTNFSPPKTEQGFTLSSHGTLFEIAKKKTSETFNPFNCEQVYHWRQRPKATNFKHYDQANKYDLSYGNCHFLKALEFMKNGHLRDAEAALQRSLELSPFHVRSQERLCFLYKQLKNLKSVDCEQRLEYLLSQVDQQYYLGKYE